MTNAERVEQTNQSLVDNIKTMVLDHGSENLWMLPLLVDMSISLANLADSLDRSNEARYELIAEIRKAFEELKKGYENDDSYWETD